MHIHDICGHVRVFVYVFIDVLPDVLLGTVHMNWRQHYKSLRKTDESKLKYAKQELALTKMTVERPRQFGFLTEGRLQGGVRVL